MKKLLLTIGLITTSMSVCADDSKFKMAVIKDSAGASSIKTGNFEQGLQSISAQDVAPNSPEQIAQKMNLCVAYASLYRMSKAEQACDQAIELTASANFSNGLERNIASLALNNRAILKAKAKDYDGALQDLLAAIKVKKSRVLTDNLIHLIQLQHQPTDIKPQQITKA